MFIRLLSDIHYEFEHFEIPQLPTDKETTLILAGDIGLSKKPYTYVPFIEQASEQFRNVIYLLGNHEHYKGNFPTSQTKIWNELLFFDNVDVVEEDIIETNDVAFICATMWTSMRDQHPEVVWNAESMMNDYKLVRTGRPTEEPWKRKLRPLDTITTHRRHRNFIFDNVQKYRDMGKKTVVVTHHGCSRLSCPDQYKNDPLSDAYIEELYNPIEEYQPDFWFHGHIHEAKDYMINNTRVVVNPKGYPHEETNFNPELVIEI